MKAQFIELSPPTEKIIHIKQVDQEFLSNPLHFHELCELVLVHESYGRRIVGNHVDSFSPGDLVLMGPNIPHIWRNDEIFLEPESKLRVKAIVIYFPSDFLIRLTDEQKTIQAMQNFIGKARQGIRFFGETKDKASKMIEALPEKLSIAKITGFLNLIELLHDSNEYETLATEAYKAHFDQQETNRINQIYVYVMSNFKESVSLNEAAEIINMTPNAFCRFFKRHTQKSFSRFVNEMRIGYACKLLMDKTYSISEVCYLSGYQNLTNFNKFFKTIMNKSPRDYRKELG